jgi:hypothetical protein
MWRSKENDEGVPDDGLSVQLIITGQWNDAPEVMVPHPVTYQGHAGLELLGI